MLKISDFSRLTQVPADTLRYYDKIGLFSPTKTDHFTRYRYYSMTQLPRLNRILALRALGLSLASIKTLLDQALSVEELRGMLRLKEAEITDHIAQEQQRLAFLRAKLAQIDAEGRVTAYDIVIKEIAPFTIAAMRGTVPTWDVINLTLTEFFRQTLTAIHACPTASLSDDPAQCGIALYHDQEYCERDIQVETAFGIVGEMCATGHITTRLLPAITAATVIHHGSLDEIGAAYKAILAWIERHRYQIVGANREINLVYTHEGDPETFVTEIQFPIHKISEETQS